MKFEAIDAQRDEFPVELMCRLLGVTKSGFYAWRRQADSRERRDVEDQRLVRAIEAVHLGSKENYGSPRVADRVRGLGHDVSDSTVARRMRKNKIRSRLKRKFKATTDSNHKLPVAPNHLMQDFTAYRPDQVYMSDITYVSTREGWLYVCGVIDLFSRKVVGWTAGDRMTKELVINAYLKARRSRSPDDWLIFHSDRGSQYASHDFAGLLRRHRVIQSMSRRACCWDAAPIESFWARLKTECVYWYDFSTRQEALRTIHAWIEHEYNVSRAHSAVDYAAPAEHERLFALASGSARE